MSFLYELYEGLPRQGPGDPASTARAFQMISGLPAEPLILDVGCGSGAQTRDLAKFSRGRVVALDNHVPFLLELKGRSAAFSAKILPVAGSMSALPFRGKTFDLIWAEGSIYLMGFSEGLKSWRSYLKEPGWAAVTEISWLKDSPPVELREFWISSYPGIMGIEENLALVREAGFEPLGHFVLPESAWWDDYYVPQKTRIAEFRLKLKGNAEAEAQLDEADHEIDLFRRFSDWYGYVFYVMKKTR